MYENKGIILFPLLTPPLDHMLSVLAGCLLENIKCVDTLEARLCRG